MQIQKEQSQCGFRKATEASASLVNRIESSEVCKVDTYLSFVDTQMRDLQARESVTYFTSLSC